MSLIVDCYFYKPWDDLTLGFHKYLYFLWENVYDMGYVWFSGFFDYYSPGRQKFTSWSLSLNPVPSFQLQRYNFYVAYAHKMFA